MIMHGMRLTAEEVFFLPPSIRDESDTFKRLWKKLIKYIYVEICHLLSGPQMGLVSFVNRNRPELTAVTFKTENEW